MSNLVADGNDRHPGLAATVRLAMPIERRLAAYDLFRSLFLREFSPALIVWVDEHSSSLLDEEHIAPLGRWARTVAADGDLGNATDHLRWEFNRLFVGPRRPPAPPYESAYRSPAKLLAQAPCAQVAADYSAWNLRIQDMSGMAEDYVGHELEFMLYLTSLEQQGASCSADGDLASVKLAQDRFLVEHVAAWMPQFCADIRTASKIEFFKVMANALEGFIDNEMRAASERLGQEPAHIVVDTWSAKA